MKNPLWLFERNRLRILEAILSCRNEGRVLCGCDVSSRLGLPKNLVSHHMRVLADKGFVRIVRCGRKKQYSLAPRRAATVRDILQIVKTVNS